MAVVAEDAVAAGAGDEPLPVGSLGPASGMALSAVFSLPVAAYRSAWTPFLAPSPHLCRPAHVLFFNTQASCNPNN